MSATSHQDGSPRLRAALAVAAAVLLTPAGYLAYVLAVRWVQGHPLTVEPLGSPQMLVYYGILSLTGVVAVLGWRWGLRVAPLATVGGLLVWPWVYLRIPIGGAGYVAVPLVAACLLTGLEWGLIHEPSAPGQAQLITGSALAAGFLHFAVGFSLHIYTRRLILLNPDYGIVGMLLGALLYLVLGILLFGTGALAVIFWTRDRVVMPAVLTLGWVSWGLYGTWLQRARFPLGEFSGFGWFHVPLRPYPDYMIGITELLVVLLAVAGIEYLAHAAARQLGVHPWAE